MTKGLVVGVDGGGTKTEAWAADLNGKVLGVGKAGPSHLRNLGIKASVSTVVAAIEKSTKEKEISSIFIGLPAFAEEYKGSGNEIKKEFLKCRKNFSVPKNKIIIDSDQIAAFRSGTDEKEGVLVISGTGCVARGWKNGKGIRSSGSGWLADEGSACWVGQQAYQITTKMLDGRMKKSNLANLVIKKFNVHNIEDLNKIIYKEHPTKILPQLSLVVDTAGDKIAKDILREAGEELALSALTVINQLNFRKRFPLVLVGGMFKSKTLTGAFKKEIKKVNPNALFIVPDKNPVAGAVKLAIENL